MGAEEVQPHAVGVEIVTKDVAALFKCPFCGDARVRLEQNAYDAWYVHCTNDCPDTVTCESYDYYEFILNIADATDIDLSKPPSMLFDRLAALIDPEGGSDEN